jgi:5-amino-6-(5-phosphoribosylamino)uracil reductase
LDFRAFAERKTLEAQSATLSPFATGDDHSDEYGWRTIGNPWTRRLYDGPFHLAPLPPDDRPAVNLVFVQSRDGNTGADNPGDLGGGETDKHLVYEGLTRAAADGVLSGATTAMGPDVFFSVWHPELVALRRELGLPRHPAQIVVTGRACFDPEKTLIFNVPEARVFVLGSEIACAALAETALRRSWVTIVPLAPEGLRGALRRLRREHGIDRISCIGGRTTATSLLDNGLVQDICLTTSPKPGGEPDTPWYAGTRAPLLDPIVAKRGSGADRGVLFEHLRVQPMV